MYGTSGSDLYERRISLDPLSSLLGTYFRCTKGVRPPKVVIRGIAYCIVLQRTHGGGALIRAGYVRLGNHALGFDNYIYSCL